MRKKISKFNLEYLKVRLFYYMIWIKENPLLFRILITIAQLYIWYYNYSADILYCTDGNIEKTLDEDIKYINEKTKKDIKYYEDMEIKGRKLMEYWNKLKNQIKLTRKERTEISNLLEVKLNDVDKAIKDNNIEYFRNLRNMSKGLMGDSKYDSKNLINKRRDFLSSKNLNPEDYPFE